MRSSVSEETREAVRERLAPFVMTDKVQKLLGLRAAIYAKKCSLVWKMVDMRGKGLNETEECRRLAWNCVMGFGRDKERNMARLRALRASGESVDPRWKALKGVLEHWKRRWHTVRMALEKEGAV